MLTNPSTSSLSRAFRQGDAVAHPSRLGLHVAADSAPPAILQCVCHDVRAEVLAPSVRGPYASREAEHLRKRTFEIPADFKIDEVLHGAFGVHVGDPANARRVVVEFSAEKTELVAGRVWHPTQVAGGRMRLSSRART